MIKIPLTQGKFALVDEADLTLLDRHSWCADKQHDGRFYAKSRIDGRVVKMHQFLMGETHLEIDHRDGDGLNNCRHNLRPATRKQNAQNSRKRRGSSSRYKGVSANRRDGNWQAHIGGKSKFLGLFEHETEAALAYDRAAMKEYGEFANLNFPRGKASSSRPTFLFGGYGRAGKDTCAEIFAKITKLRYAGSFSWHAIPFMADFLKTHPMTTWDRRHENRQVWKDRLDHLRSGDETLLAGMALATGEVTAGIRDKKELEVVRAARLFTKIFWVDRPGTPPDPTVTYGPEDCDEILKNDGTIDQLQSKLFVLAESLGLVPGLYLVPPTSDHHRE